MSQSTLMYAVAAVCAIAGTALFLRATPTEAQVYRHRIFATMLIAAALILAGFAYSLSQWEAEAPISPSEPE